jgi:hypothetical protein
VARAKPTVWLSVGLFCVAPALAAAPASIGSVEFEWVAPEECPSESQVLGDARSLIAHEPAPADAQLHARALVAHEPDGAWRLTMDVGESSRTVDGASCEELARAAALFLALLVDPVTNEAPSTEPPNATPPVAPRPVRPRAAAHPVTAPRRAWDLGAGVTGDVGTLPRAALWGMLAAGYERRAVRVGLAVAVGLPAAVTASGTTVAQLTPGLVTASGCVLSRVEPAVDWGPCLRSDLGLIRSETVNLAPAHRDAWLWWAAGGALFAAVRPASSVRVEASIGVAVPLVHPSFRIEGIGVVHELSPAARATLVASVAF